MKSTKYLLTTSTDKCVIVAEVPQNHKKQDGAEYLVSQGFIHANVKSGNFTEVTGRIPWDGRIWILTSDLS